jgi:hypothetical protein
MAGLDPAIHPPRLNPEWFVPLNRVDAGTTWP